MRTSRNEQDRIISHWQASGLSMAAYARQEGLPYHRLIYWVSQRRKAKGPTESHEGYFQELSFSAVDDSCGGSPTLRMRFAGSTCLAELTLDGVSASFVSQVVRGVIHD